MILSEGRGHSGEYFDEEQNIMVTIWMWEIFLCWEK